MSMSLTITISSWSSGKIASLMTSSSEDSESKSRVLSWLELAVTCQTLFVPACHPHESLRVTLRSAAKAFPIRILADTFEESAYGSGELLLARSTFRRR